MAKLIQPIINVKKLEQVGMVVRSIDKSVESMWKNFGIGPWNIFTVDSSFNKEMMYYGKPTKFSSKLALAKAGGLEIELIEPLDGKSIYHDFLRENGDGIHHLGAHVVNSPEEFDKITKALEKAGFPCMMSAHVKGNIAFAYFDTRKVLNTILEVLCGDPTVKLEFNISVYPK